MSSITRVVQSESAQIGKDCNKMYPDTWIVDMLGMAEWGEFWMKLYSKKRNGHVSGRIPNAVRLKAARDYWRSRSATPDGSKFGT